MTVSELKSVVFSAMQSFNQAIPAEEQLRALSQTPAGKPYRLLTGRNWR
jgi:type VI secretion system protein VasL